MVNRDRHDIVMEILEKGKSKTRKTEIMRDVGLSYAQVKLYLGGLLKSGLMELDEKNNYRTSRKGLQFLEKCQDCPLFRWEKQKDSSY